MSRPADRRQSTRRTTTRRPAKAPDPWLVPAPLPELPPPSPAHDPTALLQSLGDPPLPGGRQLASYFTAAVERASSLATALILSAELPAADPQENDTIREAVADSV